MSAEPQTPRYGYQNDEQFLKVLQELEKIKQEIVDTRRWFKQHAPQQALPFRISGVLLTMCPLPESG